MCGPCRRCRTTRERRVAQSRAGYINLSLSRYRRDGTYPLSIDGVIPALQVVMGAKGGTN